MDPLLHLKLCGFLLLFTIGAIAVTIIVVTAIMKNKLQSVAPNKNAVRILGLVVLLSFAVLLALFELLSEALLAFFGTVAGFLLGGMDPKN